ncbi:hypothetical protein [Pseudomonas fluorescens]|uniref:hypothetical protein n=1 Tax=Pseudomonas fluorescens TaxID=294 RepID=UPI000F82DC93|nr:hypothetical protein [Pseudomonas fluorescens]
MGGFLGSGGAESIQRRDFASLQAFALRVCAKSGKEGQILHPVALKDAEKSVDSVGQIPSSADLG